MNPVTYQGTTYPSQSEAARALGVHHNTILRHLNVHGSLDRLRSDPPGGCTPVTIAGRTWHSQTELARQLGVDKSTVNRWLHLYRRITTLEEN